jgi:hypothetical protein
MRQREIFEVNGRFESDIGSSRAVKNLARPKYGTPQRQINSLTAKLMSDWG